MDIKKLKERVEAIQTKLEPLQDLKKNISKIRVERDSLNKQVKELSDKLKKVRTSRDFYNKKVKNEKKERDLLNKQVIGLKKQFNEKVGGKKKGPSYSRVKKQIKDLQWKIETSGVTFSEEEKLRSKLEKLEALKADLQKEKDARLKIKEIASQAEKHHTNVLKLSEKSKKNHEKVQSLYEDLKKKRADANQKHEEVLAEMKKLKELEKKYAPDIRRLQQLKEKIKKMTATNLIKKKRETAKAFKERADEAFEKLKAGKKVDLIDLQLKLSLEEKVKNKVNK